MRKVIRKYSINKSRIIGNSKKLQFNDKPMRRRKILFPYDFT